MEYKSKRKGAPKPHNAATAIRFGLIMLGCSIVLGLAPLVIGKSGINKYIVAFAFVGGCLGLLCLLLGAIEKVQQRKPLPPLPPGEGRGEGASNDQVRWYRQCISGPRTFTPTLSRREWGPEQIMRANIAIIFLAIMSVSSTARGAVGDISISLPLEGYYRPGQLMPVQLLAPNVPLQQVIDLTADGAIRTRVDPTGTSVDGVFPWLVYSDQPRNVMLTILDKRRQLLLELKPLAANERLVGIATAQTPDDAWLQSLFPGARVIPIRIATADLTRGPVAAWGVLDALVLDAATLPRAIPTNPNAVDDLAMYVGPPPPAGSSASVAPVDPWEQRINKWLMEGVAVVIRGGEPPEQTAMWQALAGSDDDWIARVNVAGPPGYFSSDAYAPVAGWRPGRSVEFRKQLFLRAVCFAIIALAVALWKPSFAPFVTAGVVAVFIVAVAFWESRSSTTARQTGQIAVRHPQRVWQMDRWIWTSAIKPGSGGSFKPIFNSPEHALRMNATLLCAAQPYGRVAFTYDLRAGDIVAEVSRQLTPASQSMQTRPAMSPLAELVRREYLEAHGSQIEGELTEPLNEQYTEPDAWNPIVVNQNDSNADSLSP